MRKVIRAIKEIRQDAADEFRPFMSRSKPEPNCPICLETVSERAWVRPCGHVFDVDCITKWINSERNRVKGCPGCRAEMRSLRYREFKTGSGPGSGSRHPVCITENVPALMYSFSQDVGREIAELRNRRGANQERSLAQSVAGKVEERSGSVTGRSVQEHNGVEHGDEDDESIWEEDWESEGRSMAEDSHGDGIEEHDNAG